MTEAYADALRAALRGLGPAARFLTLDAPPATGEMVATRELLDPATLLPRVLRFGARLGTDDPRVAASLWSKPYTQALLSSVLTALALRGIGLDAHPDNTSVVLNDKGKPSAIRIHDLGGTTLHAPRWTATDQEPPAALPAVDLATSHAQVGAGLFSRHLEPLFAALHDATGLAPQILWGNASNRIAVLYLKLTPRPEAAEAATEDRRYFLETAATALTARGNPLYDDGTYLAIDEPGLPATIHVRRTCCLRYRLDTPRYCYTCPLATPEERLALLRQKLED